MPGNVVLVTTPIDPRSFISPVDKTKVVLASPFGNRRDPKTGKAKSFHSGVDLAPKNPSENIDVGAAAPGVVVWSEKNDSLGNCVIIEHGTINGRKVYTLYAHMEDGSVVVNVGDTVAAGQKIGRMGSTGSRSTGKHLHYTVIIQEKYSTWDFHRPGQTSLGFSLYPFDRVVIRNGQKVVIPGAARLGLTIVDPTRPIMMDDFGDFSIHLMAPFLGDEDISGVQTSYNPMYVGGDESIPLIDPYAIAGVMDVVGSSLGNYLADGNIFGGILYGSILGETFERIGLVLAGQSLAGQSGLNIAANGTVNIATAANFTTDVWNRIQGAAVGTASSMLASQLAQSLGLKGFGGEVFTTVVSTGTNALIQKVVDNLTDPVSAGTKAFDNVFNGEPLANGNMWGRALGSFVGAKLGELLVKPETEAAVVLSSVGSTVGAYVGLGVAAGSFSSAAIAALNFARAFIASGVGAFFGFVLGALIGNLFGSKKPKIPTASAETILQIPSAQYAVGAVASANGGNINLVKSMATQSRDILNGIIGLITHNDENAIVSNVSGYNTTQTYGHSGNQLYVRVNGVQRNVNSADEAVEYGTLVALRNTKIVGGDIFLKRAIVNSTAQDLIGFGGDLTTASDLSKYGYNKKTINGYIIDAYNSLSQADQDFYIGANKVFIDRILTAGFGELSASELSTYNNNKLQYDRVLEAVGAQTIAGPWIVSLLRATELRLDQWASSDFNGGLKGFISSLGGSQYAFENVTVKGRNGGAFVSAKTPNDTLGLFSVLPQALIGPDSNDIRDGQFSDFNNTWDVGSNTPVSWSRGVNLDANWAGSGNNVMFAHMEGTTSGYVVDQGSEWIPSQAGIAYETSVYAAQHRGQAQMFIQYIDANGNYTSYQLGAGAREGGGYQGDLNNFDRFSGVTTAPAGTVSRRILLRLYSTGGAAPYAFFTRPMTRSVTAGNDIANDHFQNMDVAGGSWWTWTNSTTSAQHGVNMSGGWSGSNNDSAWTHMTGTTSGQVVDLDSNWMRATPGQAYEASVYAAQHRGNVEVYQVYADANYANQTWVRLDGIATNNGGASGALSSYSRLSNVSVAPANAVYRLLVMRLVSNGQPDPFAFFTLPVSRPASYATPNWEDNGHSVWINNMGLVGYNASGSITANSDLIDRSNYLVDTSIDDYSQQTVWVESGYWEYSHWTGYDWEDQWIDTSHWETQAVTGGDDIFNGGQGNDTLNGRDGWDWLDGKGGHDVIFGGDGNDVLIGGAGNDHLDGQGGDDYIAAGDGGDGAYGGDGNDILVDGQGSECLIGQNGDDTFLIAEDYTFNWFWGGDFPHVNPGIDPNGKDTISAERLTVGVSFDIDFRPGDWNGSTDPVAGNSAARMASITDAQTGVWITNEGLFSIENATGSQFADVIYGTTGDNVLKGLDGDDKLYGRDGNDTIEGGGGADQLFGGSGFDYVSYYESSEGISVDLSTGTAYGGDAKGDIVSEFEGIKGSKSYDDLKGNSSDNIILGYSGDDWIYATAGNDTYDGGIGTDTVDFSDATSGVTAYLGSYSPSTTAYGSASGGFSGSKNLVGIEGIVGSIYADNLSGGDGDQALEGGKGNDTLNGGNGADTYYFSLGDGQDAVTSETNADSNTLTLSGDIKFRDIYTVTAGGSGGYLDLGIRGTSDKIRFNGNFATLSNNRLKTLDMNGMGQLLLGQVANMINGTDGNDFIQATGSADLILGHNGNDTLRGNGSSTLGAGDTYIGGLGDDYMEGFYSDDYYGYDHGDGRDTIWELGGEDTLVFGSSVTNADDVLFEINQDTGDLWIGLKGAAYAGETASQVSDAIKILTGGTIETISFYYEGSGGPQDIIFDSVTYHRTIEFVQVAGVSIDLTKLNLDWKYVYTDGGYGHYYPIALDLDADGLDLIAVKDSNVISKVAQGGLSRMGWVGPTDAFLAVDRNGDGAINQLSEISFAQDKPGAKSDLEGLKTWDTNGDNRLDKNDLNFNKILLWQDINQNGRSTNKELKTLTQAGIAAIDLNGFATGNTAEISIESYIQHQMKFIWADGREGTAFDIALARTAVGFNAGYQGKFKDEWGSANADGTLGLLKNDPVEEAKADRIRLKKALINGVSASYQEIKAKAEVDFSDNDRVDAKIAKRWEKKSQSERAAWLSGQATVVDDKIKFMSAEQSARATVTKAQTATSNLTASSEPQVFADAGSVNIGTGSSRQAGSAATARLDDSLSPTAGLGLALTASEPELGGVANQVALNANVQAWWLTETSLTNGSSDSSLAALLSSMSAGGVSSPSFVESPSDPSLTQQQLLLLQAMASFTGNGSAGGTAATWSRADTTSTASLAAASSLGKTEVRSLATA